jgi:hypothetical protein
MITAATTAVTTATKGREVEKLEKAARPKALEKCMMKRGGGGGRVV